MSPGCASSTALANACGAVLDHAHGEALMHAAPAAAGSRPDVHHACRDPHARRPGGVLRHRKPTNYPEFFRRCAPTADSELQPHRVRRCRPASAGHRKRNGVDIIGGQGDLFDTAATLAALVEQREWSAPTRSRTGGTGRCPARITLCRPGLGAGAAGARRLIGEALLRLVMSLNRSTRAGMFALSGLDGADRQRRHDLAVGLPRSRVGPRGLEHQHCSTRPTVSLPAIARWICCSGSPASG
ncbi:hypothetical protein [Thauera humireducens]|uniref:hypothetical protein n=1 Tax=Thauera humireducens TaxID=1134435 RepID=UPI00311FCE53